MKKILVLLLCLTMILSVFAGCDNSSTNSTQDTSSTDVSGSNIIDEVTGEIINIGSPTTMKITPEEIGDLENPVVTGLEAWPSKDHIEWKEEAYGIIYNYEQCDGSQRHAKLVTAFVSGDAYDVVSMISSDFPTLALKGLLQPLEKIFPVYDENYFNTDISNFFSLNGRCYGVNPTTTIDKYGICGINIYGVHYNKTFFDNMGIDTPLDYYNRGEWTFDNFYKLCKSTVSEYPINFNFTYLCESAVASNGSQFFRFTDTGAELMLNDPKTMEALNWVSKIYSLCSGDVQQNYTEYREGKSALLVERQHLISKPRRETNYEFGWVPFPTGPSGTGTQAGLAEHVHGIGKGAKNVEGAMAFIAANAYRETWYEIKNKEVPPSETRTEEELALVNKALENSMVNSLDGFGISFYNFYRDLSGLGYSAAVEKYSPKYQAKLDEIMGIKQEVSALDFEYRGVFNFDTADSDYPFVNVIADDKFVYGTEDIQSLKIDLTGVSELSPILYTKPELFKLQNGGQYKVTFKALCKGNVPAETFAIAARTTTALDGGTTFGLTWLELKPDEVNEVVTYINVNDNFAGDLAVVLLGSESVEGLNLVIDDFRVELISNKAE